MQNVRVDGVDGVGCGADGRIRDLKSGATLRHGYNIVVLCVFAQLTGREEGFLG